MAAITTAVAAIGVGLTAAGAATSYSAAKGQAKASQAITGLEMQAEAQRKQAMELDARRKTLEVIRSGQRARAMALAAANAQGALFGSGLQGGYGQISGATGDNMLGINQNLQIGENLFGINQSISQQRIAASQYGSQASLGSGLSSLGGALITSLPAIKGLSQIPFGSTNSGASQGYGSYIRGFGGSGAAIY